MRSWLEKRGISNVLTVSAQYQVWCDGARRWVADIAKRLPLTAWQPWSAGAGPKGERLYDGALLPLGAVAGQRQRWLLVRRSLREPKELAYDVVSAPRHPWQRWCGWLGRAGQLQRVSTAPRAKSD